MRYEVIHLKERYGFLGQDGSDPTVTAYLPLNIAELHREHQKRPCMVVCPGGAYLFCSQREQEAVALHFLPMGYNVFVLTYSTSPHHFPTQQREVAATLDLIAQNAEEWNCDVDRIAILGFSAGAHLVASYVNGYDRPEIREVLPDSRPVNACLLSYPVITTTEDISHKNSFYYLTGEHLTGDALRRFSCEDMVSERTPPTFLWHTAADENVPVENSLVYALALSKYEIPYELHIYPFGRHGLSTVDDETNDRLADPTRHAADWVPAAKKWLRLTLG